MNTSVITDTDFLHQPAKYKGKVREIYAIGADELLIIATDRLSAFDVVFPNGIPDKGRVLNQLSLFWFNLLADIIPNHIVSADINDLPPLFRQFEDKLRGRFVLAVKAKRIDVECVVRGYLAGSGWKEYQESQTVCGVKLPAGLQLASKLPEPIFTPATKEEVGEHDINVSFDYVANEIGLELATKLKNTSIAIYNEAAKYAESRGVILADTKFEFGLVNDDLILIDEILTPDSSRFWQVKDYEPGKIQSSSFDKQYIRDYLETLDWNKQPPAPQLPMNLVKETSRRYKEIFSILTGNDFVIDES
ncbi:MAG: phosphoribosylaminoimidazolesuccinocarboxamide synthase [bacterium]